MNENMLTQMKPGYSYVVMTEFNKLYDVEEALCHGTMFKELNLSINEYGKCGRNKCD